MNRVVALLFIGCFILTGSCFAQTLPPASAPVAAPAVVKPHHGRVEHHPELRKALRKLKAARADLEKAAHDYDGHKAKAIESINGAIEELQAALQSDKK